MRWEPRAERPPQGVSALQRAAPVPARMEAENAPAAVVVPAEEAEEDPTAPTAAADAADAVGQKGKSKKKGKKKGKKSKTEGENVEMVKFANPLAFEADEATSPSAPAAGTGPPFESEVEGTVRPACRAQYPLAQRYLFSSAR